MLGIVPGSGLRSHPCVRRPGQRGRSALARLALVAVLAPATQIAAAKSASDFWTELGHEMKLARLESPRIDRWEKRLRKRAPHWEVTLSAGRDVLLPIATQVRAHRMPVEFALIPAIESQFRGDAESAAGAAGLWQLMPITARHLGLKETWWRDERRDLIASTRAALRYLGYLHERFDDWLLAMAAYNAGESRVAAAIRRNKAAGKPADYWHLDLPAEAEAYVPKILALARIVRRPRGFRLPLVEQRPTIAAIDTGILVDLHRLSQLGDIPVAKLNALNPQLRRWQLDPAGPFEVYVPARKAEPLRKALASEPSHVPADWIRHTVRPGDTLGALARKHLTTVPLIKQCNGLRGSEIRVGTELLIPAGVRTLPAAVVDAAAARGRIESAPLAPEEGIHLVRPGDTLWDIARLHRLNVDHLRGMNRLPQDSVLVPGQRLLVAYPEDRAMVYVVRKGDALWHIARRFGVRVRDIRIWNDLGRDLLFPGQKLTLFLPDTPAS